jgi:hypothetical protein
VKSGGRGRSSRPRPSCAPGMGVVLMGCESPAVKVAKPLAKGKGVRREAESGGSRRQNLDPRNTNRIRGDRTWVSLHDKVKPVAAKGCRG